MTLPPFGQDPLGYVGLVAAEQPNFITADRDPTVNDQQDPGTQWFNRSATPKKIYESLGAGQWEEVAGPGASGIQTLSGDTGVASPSVGNIQIATGANLTTSASGSTVTITLDGNVPTLFGGNSGTGGAIGNLITLFGQGSVLTGATAGQVNIRGDGIKSVIGNSGTATGPIFPNAGANQITIVGSGAITTTGSGSTLTISSSAPFNNSWVVATTSPYNLAVGNNLLFDALTGQINLPNISASPGISVGYGVEILAVTSVSLPGIKVQAVATADNIIFAPATNDFKNVTSTSTGAAIRLIVVEKTGSTGLWQVVSSMGSWTGGS